MVGIIVFAVVVAIVIGTSLIKNVTMSDKLKNGIAAFLSVVAGIVIDLSTHAFDFSAYVGADILGTVLVIYGASQAIYNFILKDTALDATLESIGSPQTPQDVDPESHEGY